MTDHSAVDTELRGRPILDLLILVAAALFGLAMMIGAYQLAENRSGGAAISGETITLGVIALFSTGLLALAFAVGMLTQRLVAARRTRADLHALLEALEEPAAATSLDGTIVAVNAAMARRGARPGRPVERALSGALEDPSRQIFRVTRAAMLDGFGIELMPDSDRERPRYLVTQVIGNETMLWRLGSSLEGFSRSEIRSSRFIDAPFAYMNISADGEIRINRAFERLIGSDEETGVRVAETELPRSGGRAVLTTSSGANVLVRSFVSERGGGPAGGREVMLFPVDAEEGFRAGLSGVLEALPVALVQLDLDGNLLWANRQARHVLGREIRLGMPLPSLLEGLSRPMEAQIQEAARGSVATRPEMAKTLRNARQAPVQLVFSRLQVEGRATLLAVMADATELENMKAQFVQSQKMEAVGKLAGGVAHDFNNVLTAIVGNCDLLLLRNEEGSRDHGDLMQIRQNANRAAELVKQLLAFSRKQTMTPKLLSVRDVLSEQVYLLQRLIGERVTLRIEHAASTGYIRADGQQIEQALMNLVVNARDAMLPKGGEVLVSTRNVRFEREVQRDSARVTPGDYVEITISDEGPGIEEDVIEQIFEPFFTTKAVGEGTGLGLSTVYGIVKQSGGFIFARNGEKRGAVFTVLLPRVFPEKSEIPGRGAPLREAPAEDTTGRGSVLLVEDEAPVRSFAVRALKLRGYEVTDTESAEAALDLLSDPTFRVDTLVSDVVMPGMDGPSFVKQARQLRPGLRVIFISGYARDNFRKEMEGEDFLFLPKPFTLNELTLKVKEAVGR